MEIEILSPTVLWSVFGILCFILEIFTSGFAVFCFGVGAILAALVSFFDSGVVTQLIFFIIGSAISFVTLRPLMIKLFASPEIVTNADAVVGRIVKCVRKIEPHEEGQVKVDADYWNARLKQGSEIGVDVNESVEVVGRDSMVLIVKKK